MPALDAATFRRVYAFCYGGSGGFGGGGGGGGGGDFGSDCSSGILSPRMILSS